MQIWTYVKRMCVLCIARICLFLSKFLIFTSPWTGVMEGFAFINCQWHAITLSLLSLSNNLSRYQNFASSNFKYFAMSCTCTGHSYTPLTSGERETVGEKCWPPQSESIVKVLLIYRDSVILENFRPLKVYSLQEYFFFSRLPHL